MRGRQQRVERAAHEGRVAERRVAVEIDVAQHLGEQVHAGGGMEPERREVEAAEHPHNIARNMIIERNGLKQPAPAPRFSRTVPEVTSDGQHPGQGTREILEDWGIAKDRIDELVESGAVATS